jgi:hypothetical protein
MRTTPSRSCLIAIEVGSAEHATPAALALAASRAIVNPIAWTVLDRMILRLATLA